MKQHQQPSDEEIQSYMNFDRLLDSRKVALSSTRTMSVLKWSIPALTITTLIVWFFLAKDNPRDTLLEERKNQSGASDHTEQTTPAVTSDSSINVRREGSTLVEDENKQADAKISKPSLETTVIKEESVPVETESEYVQAEPAKGYPALYDFFSANLEYPSDGLKDSIQGVQTISFVINTTGKPEQIQVVNSLGEPFDKESRRLIENMPAWKPATLNGKPVPSKISLPITFHIQKIKN